MGRYSRFLGMSVLGTLSLSGLGGLVMEAQATPSPAIAATCSSATPAQAKDLKLLVPSSQEAILRESWQVYRDRFIQADGRVIDLEAEDRRTTSEGQAYAMLRAVWINDRLSFERTLQWAEVNLARRDGTGKLRDRLWAWKWGKREAGFGILDENFASDADVDAVFALIVAARRWNCPAYLDLARLKLRDIWTLSVGGVGRNRYQLPGPAIAFWQTPDQLIWNPSYFAPYAYRLFAQVDPSHPWLELIEPGYRALTASGLVAGELSPSLPPPPAPRPASPRPTPPQPTSVNLPPDWVILNPRTGTASSLPPEHPLKSIYSFDSYRVWWRVGLDLSWHRSPQARQYLRQNTAYLVDLWRKQRRIPARIGLQGQVLAEYESIGQYALLAQSLAELDPKLSRDMFQTKVQPTYRQGAWQNDTAYYNQNLVWFALLPSRVSNWIR